jgi:hypothetical protein
LRDWVGVRKFGDWLAIPSGIVIGHAGDCPVRLGGRHLSAIKAGQEELHSENSNRTGIAKRSGSFLFSTGRNFPRICPSWGLSFSREMEKTHPRLFLSGSENVLLGECAMWIWIRDDGEIDLVCHVEDLFRPLYVTEQKSPNSIDPKSSEPYFLFGSHENAEMF